MRSTSRLPHPSLTKRLDWDGPHRALANDVELRIGVSARIGMPPSRPWNFTVTAATDVIPDALRSAHRIDPLPTFLAWTTRSRRDAAALLL